MSANARVASVVLAAGTGTRFGHTMNKVWLQLNGKHIISRSLANSVAPFSNFPLTDSTFKLIFQTKTQSPFSVEDNSSRAEINPQPRESRSG